MYIFLSMTIYTANIYIYIRRHGHVIMQQYRKRARNTKQQAPPHKTKYKYVRMMI